MADEITPEITETENDHQELESVIDSVIADSEPEVEIRTVDTPEPEKLATEPLESEKSPSGEPAEVQKTDETKVEAKTEELKPSSDEELDKELDLVQPTQHARENTKEGFGVLKKKIKEKNTLARGYYDELQKTKAELETASKRELPEATAKELEELRKLRRSYAIEQDPEFQNKYDNRIKKLGDESLSQLENWNWDGNTEAKEKIKGFISANGGLMSIRYSGKLMPDGKATQSEWFEKEILARLTPKERDDLDDNIRETRSLLRDKSREIDSAKESAVEWEKQRQVQQEQLQTDWTKRAEKARDDMVKKLGDWAFKKEPKSTDTPEEAEEKKWHNEHLDEAVKIYNQCLGKHDPEIEVTKAFAASQATYLSAWVQKLQKQIADKDTKIGELEGTLGKVKTAGRTAKQSNAPTDNKQSNAVSIFTDDHRALENIFRERDQGK